MAWLTVTLEPSWTAPSWTAPPAGLKLCTARQDHPRREEENSNLPSQLANCFCPSIPGYCHSVSVNVIVISY
eukprot:841940-Rhodomonas_salina.2